MSSNTGIPQETPIAQQPTARLTSTQRSWSYSHKRWNAFDAWQEHVRKYATTVGTAFSTRQDRDLRRTTIAG